MKDCLKRVTLSNPGSPTKNWRALTAGLNNLPSLPELYLEIADAIHSPTASAQTIADIAGKDPALSAKLLQLSNSAFFGFSRKVFSVTEAVQLLGVGIIQSLAAAVPICSRLSPGRNARIFPLTRFGPIQSQTGCAWQMDLQSCSRTARNLAEHGFLRRPPARHRQNHPRRRPARRIFGCAAANPQTAGAPLIEIERKHFQTPRMPKSGPICWRSGGCPFRSSKPSPAIIIRGRAASNELCLAGVVHIANALQHSQATHPNLVASRVDTNYLKQVGLDHQYETLRAELTGGKG